MIARVAVCTFRRPGPLGNVLAQLAMQERPAGWSLGVLVVDNDAMGSARATVDAVANEPAFSTLAYVVEPRKGVGSARNTALEQSGPFDVLIFFDDDQVPAAGWLAAMLDAHAWDTDALWCGPVVPDLPPVLPDWGRHGWPWQREFAADRELLDQCSGGNLLVPHKYVEDGRYRFDPAFALGMGEDTELTRRLSSSGIRIRQARFAMATEPVTPERLTREWVLKRAELSSDAWARILVGSGWAGYRRLVLSVMRDAVRAARLEILGRLRHRPDLMLRSLRHRTVIKAYVAVVRRTLTGSR